MRPKDWFLLAAHHKLNVWPLALAGSVSRFFGESNLTGEVTRPGWNPNVWPWRKQYTPMVIRLFKREHDDQPSVFFGAFFQTNPCWLIHPIELVLPLYDVCMSLGGLCFTVGVSVFAKFVDFFVKNVETVQKTGILFLVLIGKVCPVCIFAIVGFDSHLSPFVNIF